MGVLDSFFAVPGVDLARRVVYRGADLQSFIEALEDNLLRMSASGSRKAPQARAWKTYVEQQPGIVQATLARFAAMHRVLSAKHVMRIVSRCVRGEVWRALSEDKHLTIAFLVGSIASSGTLAFLMFVAGLNSRDRQRLSRHIASGRIVLAAAFDDLAPSAADGPPPDMVVLLEDVVYTGGAIVSRIHALAASDRFFLAGDDAGSKKQSAFVSILCPLATTEAVRNIELALDEAGVHAYIVSPCEHLPTLFEGLSIELVLSMDTFIVMASQQQQPTVLSYMFDVLHLDDRQTLTLLPHKLDDMSMVPHTLLNTQPAFPAAASPLLCYKFRSARAALAFLRDGNFEQERFRTRRRSSQGPSGATAVVGVEDSEEYEDYSTHAEAASWVCRALATSDKNRLLGKKYFTRVYVQAPQEVGASADLPYREYLRAFDL